MRIVFCLQKRVPLRLKIKKKKYVTSNISLETLKSYILSLVLSIVQIFDYFKRLLKTYTKVETNKYHSYLLLQQFLALTEFGTELL